ncbi:MAG: hypothetical protein QXY80_07750, partial [Candidatus Jordarchaeales archaeon]
YTQENNEEKNAPFFLNFTFLWFRREERSYFSETFTFWLKTRLMSEKRKVWGDFIAIHILYQKGSQFGKPS